MSLMASWARDLYHLSDFHCKLPFHCSFHSKRSGGEVRNEKTGDRGVKTQNTEQSLWSGLLD